MSIEIKPSGVISIVVPHGQVTGGAEALHQLAHALRTSGVNASIVYLPERSGGYETPEPYRHYGVKVADFINDRPGDVLIIPETQTTLVKRFKHVRAVIWWLSVDFYVEQTTLKERVKRLLNISSMLPKSQIKNLDNMAQSAYARDVLRKWGASHVPIMSDYLSDAVLQGALLASKKRDNIVMYNPRKGLEVTREVMAHTSPNIVWRPLQNMTPSQVIGSLQESKLYVDFGHHPGRDRIPREAALAGCCILVAERGSAANEEDMPIPAHYKIGGRSLSEYRAIGERIEDMVLRFDVLTSEFEDYRNWIRLQKETFFNEVASQFRPASV